MATSLRTSDEVASTSSQEERKGSPEMLEEKVEEVGEALKSPKADNAGVKKNIARKINPGWISAMFISWVWPLLKEGQKGTLTQDDLPEFAEHNSSRSLEKRFSFYWDRLAAYYDNPTENSLPDLTFSILEMLKWEIISVIFWNIIWCASVLLFPLCLQQVLIFIEDTSDPSLPASSCYPFAAALLFTAFVRVISWNVKDVMTRSTIQTVKSCLSTSIVKKAYRLSPESRAAFSDDNTITMVNQHIPMITSLLDVFTGCTTVIYLIVDIALLYLVIGPSSLVAGAYLLLATFVSIYIGREKSVQIGIYAKWNKLKLSNFREGIQSILAVKLFSRENAFLKKYAIFRKEEMLSVLARYRISAFSNSLNENSSALASAALFASYILTGHSLTASVVYPSFLYLDLGMGLLSVVQLSSSLKALQIGNGVIGKFLCAPEVSSKLGPSFDEDVTLFVDGAKFSYGGEAANFMVEVPPSLMLEITNGITGVLGDVGSGKSTLLKGLLGLVPKIAGQVRFHGRFSYAPQKPYAMAASIKENIIFFAKGDVDYTRLSAVIKCCALERDLSLLSDGIETLIGEQGVNLSGGQKARVSLARALYFEADVYLLDDPLSSCDAKVSRLIFSNLKSFLKGKKVLFVTHSLQHLSEMDYIISLSDGLITDFGRTNDLKTKENGQFANLLTSIKSEEASQIEQMEAYTFSTAQPLNVKAKGYVQQIEAKEENEEITWETFFTYLRELGIAKKIYIVLAFFLNLALTVGYQIWLSSAAGSSSYSLEANEFVAIYIALAFGSAFATGITSLSVTYSAISINVNRSNDAVNAVFNAPLSFFHSNPVGRIITRLTNDVNKVDLLLATTFANCLLGACVVLSQAILISIASPALILLILMVIILSLFCYKYYGKASIVVQRLVSINTSNHNTVLNESLTGAEVIKSFGVEDDVLLKYQEALDKSLASEYILLSASIWFEQRLGLLSIFLLLACLVAGFYVKSRPAEEMQAGAAIIGLALVNSVMFGYIVEYSILMATYVAQALNSYQRLLFYRENLPQEAARFLPTDPLIDEWPSKGLIAFKEMTISYENRPEYDIVKKFNATIHPGEKIGVIGRTGAGKSTLISAISRLVEAKEGLIRIDGLDINCLGLHTLRSRIQVIPQSPVLFDGTIRSNLVLFLDEGKENSSARTLEDVDVWQALTQTGMKEYIQSLEGQLDAKVLSEGSNFSHGQRQLLCLARAIISKPKILIMDEATASIDEAADERIQSLIKTQFKDTTVISIAHRLASVRDCDRIMALSEGRLVEFGSPKDLLDNPLSMYNELVSASSSFST